MAQPSSSAHPNDPRFLFFSSLLGRPVLDFQGRQVGRVADLVAATSEPYPPVEGLLLKAKRRVLQVPWGAVDAMGARALRLKPDAPLDEPPPSLPADRIRLAEELLDKQIVDVED